MNLLQISQCINYLCISRIHIDRHIFILPFNLCIQKYIQRLNYVFIRSDILSINAFTSNIYFFFIYLKFLNDKKKNNSVIKIFKAQHFYLYRKYNLNFFFI